MFISGAYFQEQCKWNLDNRYPIRKWKTPFELSTGDSVFLKVCDIPSFVSLRLLEKVELVVHNSDESFTDELYDIVKPYITKVSAVNCITKHATQIPLGLRDHQYTSHHILRAVMSEPDVSRDILCLVNFLIQTNYSERQYVYELFKENRHCTVDHDYMYYSKSIRFSDEETQKRRVDFYRKLKRSKYALCPAGTGIDTHRVYECIHLGVIPIVKTSPLNTLYAGMPVKIITEWSEVIPLLESEPRLDTPQPAQ